MPLPMGPSSCRSRPTRARSRRPSRRRWRSWNSSSNTYRSMQDMERPSMRRYEKVIATVLSSAWLAGCATSALKMAPERPDRPWVPPTTETGEIIAGEPQVPPTAEGYVLPANPALGQFPPPSGIDAVRSYALPELIDLAESHNPATRIAWNDARRAALAAGVAESAFLPNITATAIGGDQGSTGHETR